MFDDVLKGKDIHEIRNFQEIMPDLSSTGKRDQVPSVMCWLNKMFAKPH